MTPEKLPAHLYQNLARVQSRMSAACEKVNRPSVSVQLVAVTKSVPPEVIQALTRCGLNLFGENRPQQLVERAQELNPQSRTPLNWHLIGPLQSNKIRSLLPWASTIHSVDSLELLQKISRIAGELSLRPRLLLQVNVSGEASKGGFDPDALRKLWNEVEPVQNVEIAGLMTMAPFTQETDVIRSTFRGLRELRDELQAASTHVQLRELSMGMSHDFEIAIEEGSTMVRIGSLLYEGISEA